MNIRVENREDLAKLISEAMWRIYYHGVNHDEMSLLELSEGNIPSSIASYIITLRCK